MHISMEPDSTTSNYQPTTTIINEVKMILESMKKHTNYIKSNENCKNGGTKLCLEKGTERLIKLIDDLENGQPLHKVYEPGG